MGLAGAFGDQAYVCKACGHSTGLYSPQCPVCLNKTLQRVEKVQHPGPSATNTNAPQYEDDGRPGRFPIELVAIVIGLLVVAYSVFIAPHQKQAEDDKPVVKAQEAPRPRPVVHHAPVHHAAAAASRPNKPSAAAVAAAHRAPMKLWSSSDSE